MLPDNNNLSIFPANRFTEVFSIPWTDVGLLYAADQSLSEY